MRVYVVEKGDYSDRRVIAVCKTKEIAEKYCDLTNEGNSSHYDEAYWYEWDVVDKDPEKVIIYYRQGIVTGGPHYQRVEKEFSSSNAYIDRKAPNIINASMVQSTGPRGGLKPEFFIRIEGGSKSHVDKAFQDRVAQAKAILAGVT